MQTPYLFLLLILHWIRLSQQNSVDLLDGLGFRSSAHFPPYVAREEGPHAGSAFYVRPAASLSLPLRHVFPDGFPVNFSVSLRVRVVSRARGYVYSVWDGVDDDVAWMALRIDGNRLDMRNDKQNVLIEFPRSESEAVFDVPLFTGDRWDDFSFSVHGNVVLFFWNCQLVGGRKIRREKSGKPDVDTGTIYVADSGSKTGKKKGLKMALQVFNISSNPADAISECGDKEKFLPLECPEGETCYGLKEFYELTQEELHVESTDTLPKGPEGPASLCSCKGEPGEPGIPGMPGIEGFPGLPGPRGPQGPSGEKGERGVTGTGVKGEKGDGGSDGKPGLNGAAGLRGKRGVAGLPGPKGEPGRIIRKKGSGLGIEVVDDEDTMASFTTEGSLVYRRDLQRVFVLTSSRWRPLMFSDEVPRFQSTTSQPDLHSFVAPTDDGAPIAPSSPPQPTEPGAIVLFLCGNGIVDDGEECDDENDESSDDCVDCRRARCGDGVMWIGVEECDANDFGGHSCQTIQGQMSIGRLSCTARCAIDMSSCRPTSIVLTSLNDAQTGSLGGLRGADSLCHGEARSVAMAGNFKAFLSNPTRELLDLVRKEFWHLSVVNIKNETLYSSWENLVTGGSEAISNPRKVLSFDGEPVPTLNIWLGPFLDAKSYERHPSKTCDSWTSRLPTLNGKSGHLTRKFVQQRELRCNTLQTVLCVLSV